MTILAKILHTPSDFFGRKHWAGVAKYFYDLAEKARYEGLLSLEEYICDEQKCVLDKNRNRAFSRIESRIFYEGMSLILDGIDGRDVRAILKNLIARTVAGRSKRIALAIGLEGICAVQAGDNPLVIKKRLGSLADLRTYDLIQRICVPRKTPLYERCMRGGEVETETKAEADFSGERDISSVPHGAFSPFRFDDIAFLDNTAIQKALRELDSQTLSLALKDTRFSILRKILGNMSKTTAKMLCDDIEHLALVTQSRIDEAREKVVSVFVRLRESGEIVFAGEKDEK